MNWRNHLIMCPSQCEADTEVPGVVLYMRWRHHDPWSFAVVRDIDGPDGGAWCHICNDTEFGHDDYEEAQTWFEKLWNERKNDIIKILDGNEGVYATGNK